MKPEVFTQTSSNVYSANQVLKFAVVVLSISSFLTMCVAAYAIATHKTVFIPPGIEKEIWVSDNDANDEYIITFIKYATYLLADYHPTNIHSQYQELRRYISTEYFPEFDKTLRANEDTIKKLGVSCSFYPQKFTLDRSISTVTVKGVRRQFALDNSISSSTTGYKIVYVIKHRRMYINEISEIKAQ